MFIPEGPGGSLQSAISCCHGWDGQPACPVRISCYQAGEAGDEIGVWGGQVRNQRGVRVVVALATITDMRPHRLK